MIPLSSIFDFGLETPFRCASSVTMALDIAAILFFTGVAVAGVLIAARRGYLGHRRRRGSDAAAKTSTASVTGQVGAVAPAAPTPAPSHLPANYETVQPAPTPTPASFSGSSGVTLGAPPSPRRTTGNYKRRTAPTRSTATKDSTENKPS